MEDYAVLALFGQLGLPELLIILAIIVLIFGASRIPQVARSLGEAVREFRKASREAERTTEELEKEKSKQ